jgi:drug/metabolite transporter (DMT)-like permease
LLSILYGIASAASWGAADFIGGLASKRTSPFRVIFMGELAGVIPFLVLAFLTSEALPPFKELLWSSIASLLGLGGLIFLYRSLASGQMTIAAPVSAVFSALIPILYSILTEGLPSWPTLLGFGLAFLAIWFISQTNGTDVHLSLSDLRLPLTSGLFFGFYFIAIHQATLTGFFWPLVSTRVTGLIALGCILLATRQPVFPPRDLWGPVIWNGILDTGGNAFYVLAARTGRLDVAAVLGALYPATTVLLAWILLKEKITPLQTLGIVLAFGAITLMTL